ncbi:FapA family protein [Halodesulfovibrio marinisediminis]|uniref:DUF342 domain-containing protein n=1 Tax=Halodesulfovibrio marinisediminis DSM 17456 TaxID=1121457 RepID=A0A1N6I679_9BACT|nr:FapA family protein [Halodesulfovibrio marinisediminis]SIO27514.1 hypothetical protein SAMN02745161_2447 [Halodesulfovibrio marinisediminis DSM 17456]
MTYYLRHYFDPFFNHTKLSPAAASGGRVDHHCLGYVQNVIAGQVLAEFVPTPENTESLDPQFIFDSPVLPAGPNTMVNPENSHQLLAEKNGYVFYHEDLISVKKLLNIHGDVNYSTGNVIYVNDLCVHGTVRTGFELLARNILAKGTVEGATIRALAAFTAEKGIKGAKSCVIDAGSNIRAGFCENSELHAGNDIYIEGSSLHTDMSLNGTLVVKERLQGGKVYANNMVYVGEQLGGGINTPTSIIMGYPPALMRKLGSIEEKISAVDEKIKQLLKISAKSDLHRSENRAKLEFEEKRMGSLRREQRRIMNLMKKNANSELCRVIVPGTIRPGVEISIGGHYTKINDYLENVAVSLRDGELRFNSPAIIKK